MPRERSGKRRAHKKAAPSTTPFAFVGLMRAISDAIVVSNDATEIIGWNLGAERILGYTAEEAMGRSVRTLMPETTAALYRRHMEQLASQGSSEFGEAPFQIEALHKNGKLFPCEITISTWKHGPGVYTGAILRDITARQKSEHERSRLAMAVEQAGEAIVITEPDARIVYVNPEFERMSGYHRDEVVGQTPSLMQSGKQDDPFYRALWETIARGDVWSGVFVNRRKDGTLFDVQATISPVRDGSGRIVHYVAVERDVTHVRALEAQLLQAQKLEAVGRLAAGVAHDFNNLLTVIVGHAQLSEGALEAGRAVRPHLEEILKAGERAAGLTRQLLAFSRQQVLQPKVLDLNGVLADITKMLRRLIGEDIRLEMAAAAGLGRVKVDPTQIEQVVMNLAVNARDAMPNGGSLTLETANVELDDPRRSIGADLPPGRYVMLAVSDTGCGISPEVKNRMFEPFFTTKEIGKGSGLGLATVLGIVKQSGGHIEVLSEPGLGATFKVYLPRIEGEAEMRADIPLPPRLNGTETILLAEDEEAVRMVIADTLRLQGYTVIEATDGSEAIARCERGEPRIQLLIADVVMPLMSGPELAERITRVRPDLSVLFISGYTDRALTQQRLHVPGTAFLQKPFTPDALARRVREVLDEPLAAAA